MSLGLVMNITQKENRVFHLIDGDLMEELGKEITRRYRRELVSGSVVSPSTIRRHGLASWISDARMAEKVNDILGEESTVVPCEVKPNLKRLARTVVRNEETVVVIYPSLRSWSGWDFHVCDVI